MSKREITDHYGVGLLPCPLCGAFEAQDGGEAWSGGVFLREDHRPPMWDGIIPARVVYVVQCGRCGVQITYGTFDGVIRVWNRRTKPGEEPEDKIGLPAIIRTRNEGANKPEETP